jgi:DME family drug/metabolite transporter
MEAGPRGLWKAISRPGAPGFALVACAAVLWGSDALFRRGLALELPAETVVFAEHVILVVLTLPLLRGAVRKARTFGAGDWASIILVGAGASATATILFTEAFSYGDPTTPLLLQKLQPLVAVVGARVLLKERILPRFSVYVGGALGGAYLVAFPDPVIGSVSGLRPALLALGAASLWGLGTVLGRGLSAKVDPLGLTALRFAFGLPASGLILLFRLGPSGVTAIRADDLPALLLLALVPGLLALVLYYRGLSRTPAAAATIAELGFPVSAVAINLLAFGSTLTATQWAGLVLLSGTITTMGAVGGRDTSRVGVVPSPAVSLGRPA